MPADSNYWRRSLRPWKGEWVVIGCRSGTTLAGRLIDATAEGPVLDAPHERKPVCRWQDVQYVEQRLVRCAGEP